MLRKSRRGSQWKKLVLVVVVLAFAVFARQIKRHNRTFETSSSQTSNFQTSNAQTSNSQAVEALFEQGLSDRIVQVEGVVDRVLRDDLEGSEHQRFVLRLGSGHTLLVAHNIDLSQRVPLKRSDLVEARGEYEWNERGGVLHWTHRDPQGRHEDGWIRHEGQQYD